MRDKYSKHEALHMAWLASDFVERYVYQHPAIEADDRCRSLALEAAEKLAELYQLLGSKGVRQSTWRKFLEMLVDE